MSGSAPSPRGREQPDADLCLIARPLDFIAEVHLRERQICALIDGLVSARAFDRRAAVSILRFLNEEVGVHLRDEAEDLFQALAGRCRDDESIDTVLTRVRADQERATALLPKVRRALLIRLDSGGRLSDADREVLAQFADRVRRHLIVENAIILPMARARLTRADLRRLASGMRSRRGLSGTQELPDAQ